MRYLSEVRDRDAMTSCPACWLITNEECSVGYWNAPSCLFSDCLANVKHWTSWRALLITLHLFRNYRYRWLGGRRSLWSPGSKWHVWKDPNPNPTASTLPARQRKHAQQVLMSKWGPLPPWHGILATHWWTFLGQPVMFYTVRATRYYCCGTVVRGTAINGYYISCCCRP